MDDQYSDWDEVDYTDWPTVIIRDKLVLEKMSSNCEVANTKSLDFRNSEPWWMNIQSLNQ